MLQIELLQVALGVRNELSLIPTDVEWDSLYAFAEKQAIVGVLFGGIERLPKHQLPSMDFLMDWLGQAEYIKTQNGTLNDACKHVTDYFDRDGSGLVSSRDRW